MKTLFQLMLVAVPLFAPRLSPAAQPEANDWSGFNAGAGRSAKGAVQHFGVIGGWLHRPVQSSNYWMEPGLPWMPIVDSTPQLPVLRIRRVGDAVRVAWPAWASNFVLETQASFGSVPSWTPVADPVQQSEGELFVLVAADAVSGFYRLRSP